MTRLDKGMCSDWLMEQVDDHIFEITPIEDSREHFLLDECWCQPQCEHVLHNILCSDGIVRGKLIYSHNAEDGRPTGVYNGR